MHSNVTTVLDFEEFKKVLEEKKGFIRASWCADEKCADNIKAHTTATVRFLPFDKEDLPSEKCLCGEAAKQTAYFAKSY